MRNYIYSRFCDDKDEVINLYEKYLLAKDRDIVIFGNNFYTINVWKWFEETFNTKTFKIECEGIFEESERRMISFNNIYNENFPIKMFKIVNKSKFSNLKHSDYLGAIMSLGIKRNKIGDLIVKDNICYVVAHEDIEEYLLYNIQKIGNCLCDIELITEYDNLPKINFKEEIILVSSLRIDGIVSKLINVSRTKAEQLVKQGLVLVDYNVIRDKSYELKEKDRVTIRRGGKFIIDSVVGKSKSGKIKMSIKKYT